MSAIPLFDLLVSHSGSDSEFDRDRLKHFAENIVADAILRFEQTKIMSANCVAGSTSTYRREVAALLRSMYEEDVQYAERILARIAKFEKNGTTIKGADALRDYHGHAMARLSVPLEEIDAAREEIRQGQYYTGAQVRDELQRQILATGKDRAEPTEH